MTDSSKFSKSAFAVLYAMGLLIYMLKSLVGVSFPFLKANFGFTPLQLGNIAATYFWTYSISFLVLGVVTRKIGVRWHAIITYIGMGICELLMAFANSYHAFLWIKAVEGVVSAGFFLCSATIVFALFVPERRKQVQSYQISSIGVSNIIIALILVPLMNYFSWRIGYIFSGCFALLIAVFIFVKIPEITLNESGVKSVSYWSILWRKNTILIAANLFFINLYLYAIMNFAVLYFVEEKHFSTQAASNLALVNAITAFVMINICGFLTKYFKPKYIYFVSILIISAFGLGIVYSQYYAACMALGYGISFGGFSMIMAMIQQLYAKNEIPIAAGLGSFGGAIGGAVAPSLFGYILQTTHSYNDCFFWLSGLVLLSLFFILPLKERVKS